VRLRRQRGGRIRVRCHWRRSRWVLEGKEGQEGRIGTYDPAPVIRATCTVRFNGQACFLTSGIGTGRELSTELRYALPMVPGHILVIHDSDPAVLNPFQRTLVRRAHRSTHSTRSRKAQEDSSCCFPPSIALIKLSRVANSRSRRSRIDLCSICRRV